MNPHQTGNAHLVVLLDNPDGSIDRIAYVDPGNPPFSWIRDTLDSALAAAQKQLAEGNSDVLTHPLTVDGVRRVWPEVWSD